MPPNKALQTGTTSCHTSCIRKSQASFPLPLSLVVGRHREVIGHD